MWRQVFLLFGLSLALVDLVSAQQLVDLNLATKGPRDYDTVTAPMDASPAANFELARPTFLILTYVIEIVPEGTPKGGYQMFPVVPANGPDWEANYTIGRTLSVKNEPAEMKAGGRFRQEIVTLATATPAGIAIRCKLVPHHIWQAFQIGNRGTQLASAQALTVTGVPFDEFSGRDNTPPKWDISGTWGHGDPSGERATWTFTSKGNGEYEAIEKGFSNSRGTARVRGNRIYIDYTTTTAKGVKEIKGVTIIDLDPKGIPNTGHWANENGIGGTNVWTSTPAKPIGSDSKPSDAKEKDDLIRPVDISGTWQHGSAGETWTFTPIGPGEYIAVEKGFGNAKGKAKVNGNKCLIDFTISTGKKGTYDLTINPDGMSAKGIWSEVGGSSGSRDFVKVFGGGTPSTDTPSVPNTALTVQAGKVSGNAGQVVDVPISILQSSGISNVNVVVKFDPSIAKVNAKPTAGSLLSNRLFETNYSETGTVRVGFAGAAGLKQDGVVATIPFALIGSAGSSCPLKITVTSANSEQDQALTAATVDGLLTILGPKPEDKPPEIPVFTALDALQALKMSVKLLPENLKVDIDADGRVTSNDARLILKKVVGSP